MEHLKNLLSKRLKSSGLANDVAVSLIIEEFTAIIADLFDPEINKRIKPVYIKDKKLMVSCVNSVLKQELNFKIPEIINKLNKKFGDGTIKEIRFVLWRVIISKFIWRYPWYVSEMGNFVTMG